MLHFQYEFVHHMFHTKVDIAGVKDLKDIRNQELTSTFVFNIHNELVDVVM